MLCLYLQNQFQKPSRQSVFKMNKISSSLRERDRETQRENTNLKVTNNTVICQVHWPSNFDTIKVQGKMGPQKSTICMVRCAKEPNTNCSKGYQKTSSSTRNQIDYKMNAFFIIR